MKSSVEVFCRFAEDANYLPPSSDVRKELLGLFSKVERGPGFGNARLARQVFETAVSNLADRLSANRAPARSDLTTIDIRDLPARG